MTSLCATCRHKQHDVCSLSLSLCWYDDEGELWPKDLECIGNYEEEKE